MARFWAPIEEPYMHGVYAEVGSRKAEVVREYASQWTIFRYVDGTMVRTLPDTPTRYTVTHATLGSARRVAREWLLERSERRCAVDTCELTPAMGCEYCPQHADLGDA